MLLLLLIFSHDCVVSQRCGVGGRTQLLRIWAAADGLHVGAVRRQARGYTRRGQLLESGRTAQGTHILALIHIPHPYTHISSIHTSLIHTHIPHPYTHPSSIHTSLAHTHIPHPYIQFPNATPGQSADDGSDGAAHDQAAWMKRGRCRASLI